MTTTADKIRPFFEGLTQTDLHLLTRDQGTSDGAVGRAAVALERDGVLERLPEKVKRARGRSRYASAWRLAAPAPEVVDPDQKVGELAEGLTVSVVRAVEQAAMAGASFQDLDTLIRPLVQAHAETFVLRHARALFAEGAGAFGLDAEDDHLVTVAEEPEAEDYPAARTPSDVFHARPVADYAQTVTWAVDQVGRLLGDLGEVRGYAFRAGVAVEPGRVTVRLPDAALQALRDAGGQLLKGWYGSDAPQGHYGIAVAGQKGGRPSLVVFCYVHPEPHAEALGLDRLADVDLLDGLGE